MTYLRCSCGMRVDAETRIEAWTLLDQHVEAVHGRSFPERVTDHVVSDQTRRKRARLAREARGA